MNFDWINTFRRGAEVKRLHTRPTLRECTNGHHTLNAIAIAMYLCSENDIIPDDVIKVLIMHDIPEEHTGDIPGPIKREPGVKEVVEELEKKWMDVHMPTYLKPSTFMTVEKDIVKAADMLELLWWAVEEREMGNTRMDDVYQNIMVYMKEHGKNVELFGVEEIVEHLTQRWRNTW